MLQMFAAPRGLQWLTGVESHEGWTGHNIFVFTTSMSDSDDDWETQDVPVVLNKKDAEEEEDLALTELAAEEAKKAQHQTRGQSEEEKRKEEVWWFSFF